MQSTGLRAAQHGSLGRKQAQALAWRAVFVNARPVWENPDRPSQRGAHSAPGGFRLRSDAVNSLQSSRAASGSFPQMKTVGVGVGVGDKTQTNIRLCQLEQSVTQFGHLGMGPGAITQSGRQLAEALCPGCQGSS